MQADLYIQIEEQRLEIDAFTHIVDGLNILMTLHENNSEHWAEMNASLEDYSKALIVSQAGLVLLEGLLADRLNEKEL